MSPYEILGIEPTASIAEAEAAYRTLLRACHPDLHVHEGPDAVAWAEQRTRSLNAAIHALRAGHAHAYASNAADDRTASTHAHTHAHAYTYQATSWPITCVLCGLGVEDSRSYRAHLLLDHAFSERARRRRIPRRTNWLSWMPAPMFWSLMLLVVYSAVVFQVWGDSGTAIAGWWVGILAFLLFLPAAYRAERYRRRF